MTRRARPRLALERQLLHQPEQLGIRRAAGVPLVRRPAPELGDLGATHTAPSKYHDEIISFVFIHTKYGEPIVIMVFRRAIQKVLCLTPRCRRLRPVERRRRLSSACDGADHQFQGQPRLYIYMIQPLVELYEGCMVVLKVS